MKTRKFLVSGVIAIFMVLIITGCPDSPKSTSGVTQTVVKPAASPAGGYYSEAPTVTLSTATSGAKIYYTLDGNTPTINSDEYSAPIHIKHTSTLKAIAVKSGMNNSEVLSEQYIITPPGQVVQPVASPEGGYYTTTQTVTLSTITQGANIYFTLDESEPTTESQQYASPITIEHTTTIKAIAVKTDMHDSDIMTEEYIITPPGQVVQPAVNHHSGTYFGNQTITLSTLTEGAAIYYTLDETEPTTTSTLYSVPINISETTVLKAFAVKEGMHDSDVMTANYVIIDFPLIDLNNILLCLSTQTGTTDNPIYLSVQIDLGTMTEAGSGWRNLLDIIAEADEFVDLDLSACTMTGIEFNPDYNIATGKDKIVSIALPDTAISIPYRPGVWNGSKYEATFENFIILKSFSGKGLTYIGGYAFSGCTNLALTSLPAGLISIDYFAFYDCTNLALTSLPEGLTYIGDFAFRFCTNLILTSLPEGLTYIGSGAFQGCTNLALTSLPAGLTSIGGSAFYDCANLALTSLPEGLTSIGNGTFYGCANLALTSLPESITSIGYVAFSRCTNLALVTCLAVTPPTLGTDVFLYTHASLRIEVPAGSVAAYKAAENWSAYANRIFAITP